MTRAALLALLLLLSPVILMVGAAAGLMMTAIGLLTEIANLLTFARCPDEPNPDRDPGRNAAVDARGGA